MPSDANGVYSLPGGYLAVTGETIQASQHNPPLEDIATAVTARLMRSGVAPMTGSLKIVDGSVGAPAVQFSNGPTTGLYKTTNGIGVSINGTKVAEFIAGGLVSGARWIGELIPFTGITAPALTVVPFGQTLSRTTYADLWTFAQAQIALGNLFYNNGDGSTTFGIGDMRGRVAAGTDGLAGAFTGRLNFTNSSTIGGTGGSTSVALSTFHLPPYTPSGSIANGAITTTVTSGNILQSSGLVLVGGGGSFFGYNLVTPTATSTQAPSTFTGSAQGGSSTPFSIAQHTMATNFILFAGA